MPAASLPTIARERSWSAPVTDRSTIRATGRRSWPAPPRDRFPRCRCRWAPRARSTSSVRHRRTGPPSSRWEYTHDEGRLPPSVDRSQERIERWHNLRPRTRSTSENGRSPESLSRARHLLVIGATRHTGKHVVHLALEAGHAVTALARVPARIDV